MGVFPFGMPITPLAQRDRRPKSVFVIGDYAGAVYACWYGPDGRIAIPALPVASEPELFWRGDGADRIVAGIRVPEKAGRLVAANDRCNGQDGRALDDLYLAPLGSERSDAWLCELVPESRRGAQQTTALARTYDAHATEWALPRYDWPAVPAELTTVERRAQIAREVIQAAPEVMITLGDDPLRWFTRFYGSKSRLADYGDTPDTYGRLHPIAIAGQHMQLLPLVGPRQAAGHGGPSDPWMALHRSWVRDAAGE